jgi:hypothetical protein
MAAGCGDDGGPGQVTIQDFVVAMSSLDGTIDGSFNADNAPAASGGPTLTATGSGTIITGGSTQVGLSASGEFVTIVVSIEGVAGSWRMTVPATLLSSLLLTFAAQLPQDDFDLRFQVIDDAGGISSVSEVATSVVTVGTGVVQVSVSWNTNADVDLYVVEPGGEEIYYGHRTSATGGELDLDSNVGCAAGPQNENITWTDTAPSGSYAVRVNYFSDCTHASTNYVVTVRRDGQQPQTYTGTLNAPGLGGGAGAGVAVTTFSF